MNEDCGRASVPSPSLFPPSVYFPLFLLRNDRKEQVSKKSRFLWGFLISLFIQGLLLVSAASGLAQSEIETGSVTIRVDGSRIIHQMAGGIGASWHAIESPIPVVGNRSHGGSGWGGYPVAGEVAAWRQIYRHADWLGLDFCRVELEQRIYEPDRNQFTWDSSEMQILYRILDWCERRKVDVFLQQMWGNVEWNTFPEFQGDPVKRVHSGPRSMDDFAQGLAALANHLVNTKRYRCIKWICINNEPGYEWSWWQRPPNEPMPLRDGLAAVRRALDAKGIRIPLSGPDWTDLPELEPGKVDFDEFIGAYDLHSYFARFDWMGGSGYALRDAEQRIRHWGEWSGIRGKPLFLSEVGSMVFGWGGSDPGPRTFSAAIKDVELVVRGINLGVDGFNRWSFINRGDLDGQWQMIETWNPQTHSLRKEISPAPNSYFVYGLLSRFIAQHSQVLSTAVGGGQIEGLPRVFAAALRSQRGNLTLAVVNDAEQSWNINLEALGLGVARLFKYQVTSKHSDRPELRIEPLSTLKTARGSLTVPETMPPLSLTIFSSYKLHHRSAGIIAD